MNRYEENYRGFKIYFDDKINQYFFLDGQWNEYRHKELEELKKIADSKLSKRKI